MKKESLTRILIALAVVLVTTKLAFFNNVKLVDSLKVMKPVYKLKPKTSEKEEMFRLGLDLKGGVYVVLEAKKEDAADTKSVNDEDMEKLVEVLDRRVNGMGVSEATVQRSGENRVIVEIPGVTDTEQAIKMIGKTALLEFKLVQEDGSLGPALVTGRELVNADVTYDELGRPQIGFELNPDGAKKFAEVTAKNIGKNLAITLDGVQQTAPRIQSEIPGGRGVITGNYDFEEAKSMATLLKAGALPLKVEIMELH